MDDALFDVAGYIYMANKINAKARADKDPPQTVYAPTRILIPGLEDVALNIYLPKEKKPRRTRKRKAPLPKIEEGVRVIDLSD